MNSLHFLRRSRCILQSLRVGQFFKTEQAQSRVTACYFTTCTPRMESLKDNPYFNRYADKLKKKQEENPEEFEANVSSVVEKHKKDLEDKKKEVEEEKARLQEEASQIKPGTLNQIMKVDLVKDKTKDEIVELWTEHHKNKDCIFAVLNRDEYEEIYKRSKEFGTFIYPIPRGAGYEFFLQQFSGHTVNFTALLQYQAHKENAPTCLTVTHYTELLEDQGIVLMCGEPDTKVLSVYESQLLALQLKMYYGLQSGLKFNLVRVMNTSPDNFRHMDMIKHFEDYKKDVKLSKEVTEWKVSQ